MRGVLEPLRSRVTLLSAFAVVVLAGCASVDIERQVGRINEDAASFTEGNLSLARTEAQRTQRAETASRLLKQPLGADEAVHLALVNSDALQVLLARGWTEAADAAQIGRTGNPIFSFERLAAGGELEIGRALTVGLLDVLTLPMRQQVANRRIEQSQLRLTGEVVERVTQVRQAWVRAVAARQSLGYAKQVYESAEASAELARRMQATGNFNRIARARQQAFYADAATRLVMASHHATATREALVRLMGLGDDQARDLILPDRLPGLPEEALQPEEVGSGSTRSRLDIRLAQTTWEVAAKAQGLNAVARFTDLELTARRDSRFDDASGMRTDPRGYEIGIRLPVFDWQGMQRDAMNARTLAAAYQLEATVRSAGSSLRESYSAYRTAYDVARHQRDEIVPLRKVIAEETMLRFNAMLIGVFELLADSREQIDTVIDAIDAEQRFWLADASLQAEMIGRPNPFPVETTSRVRDVGAADH